MAAIFTKMSRYTICASLNRGPRACDGVWMLSAPRVPHCRNVIYIDPKPR
jgi:hypothetical protein